MLQLQGVQRRLQTAPLGQIPLRRSPFRQARTLGLGPGQLFPGLPFLVPGLVHLGQLFPVGLPLQGGQVNLQGLLPAVQGPKPLLQPGGLDVQLLQSLQLTAAGLQLPARLGQQAGLVVPAFVFQLPQAGSQGGAGGTVVSCGDQPVQPVAQGLVPAYGQVPALQEAGALVYAALHAQQNLPAPVRRQLRDGETGFRLEGAKVAHGNAPLGLPLDGNAAILPQHLHRALHGLSGPGLVPLLVRQLALAGPLPGVDSVEHGQKEGAPGAFSPLVGGGDEIQPGGKGQGLSVQLPEGGGHGAEDHGSVTSCPSRIWRLMRAARQRASCSAPSARSAASCSS